MELINSINGTDFKASINYCEILVQEINFWYKTKAYAINNPYISTNKITTKYLCKLIK